MALVTLKEILKNTKSGHYAVGAFNFNGYEDAQGMINGAVEKRSPIILMASVSACKYIGLKQTAGMVKAMAESVDIPVCLHLDHATDYDHIKAAVMEGFSSVMVDASARDYETNIRDTRAVVEFARKYRCSVEAELGKVGGKEEEIVVADRSATFTDPADVRDTSRRRAWTLLRSPSARCTASTRASRSLTSIGSTRFSNSPTCHSSSMEVPASQSRTSGSASLWHGQDQRRNRVQEGVHPTPSAECARNSPSPKSIQEIHAAVKDICAEIVKGKIDIFGSAERHKKIVAVDKPKMNIGVITSGGDARG